MFSFSYQSVSRLFYKTLLIITLFSSSVTAVDNELKKLKEIVANLENETKVKHNYLIVDFNNFDSYKKIISTFLSNNPIDILVNNTQGPKPGDVESLSIDDYQNAFDLLFKSVVHTTSVALSEHKKEAKYPNSSGLPILFIGT